MTAPLSNTEHRWLKRAFKLAKNGRYTCKPNPKVGCVLVKDEQLIGQGWHHQAGQAHAEINALKDCALRGHLAKGATLFVTLEPCSHTGRTGPCTQAIIQAGVQRVIIGGKDPNPQVNGQGIQQLRQAGIDVISDVMPKKERKLNKGIHKRYSVGLPWVTLKLASTLDGRTAAADQSSRWITNTQARLDVHQLRLMNDAVLTGVNTILTDDPQLNARLEGSHFSIHPIVQPQVVVLDSALNTPTSAKILAHNPWIIASQTKADPSRKRMLEQHGATIHQLPSADRLNLKKALNRLADHNINSVLVEAGATLSGALLSAGLVDELILYLAPSLLGSESQPLLHLPSIQSITDKHELKLNKLVQLQDNIKLTLSSQLSYTS